MSRYGKRHAPNCECTPSFSCRACFEHIGPTLYDRPTLEEKLKKLIAVNQSTNKEKP